MVVVMAKDRVGARPQPPTLGFVTLLYDFIVIIQQFLEILVIFGGYWALF
jgi:hypothetical protein